MNIKTILVAGAVLTSSVAQAMPEEMLPSTVCFPAIQALQEPTTEANLTPYDPFNHIETSVDDGLMPDVEPTATGMAILVLKEIAKVVGTKIYEQIFRDGAKRTLTKADFERISQIVKEALREDAKRKINNCVISIQETSRELATSWDQHIATDLYTTSGAVIDTIYHFDHLYSKIALLPSAMLIGSLRAGVAQELLVRDASKTDEFFHMGVKRLTSGSKDYLEETYNKLLDPKNPFVRTIRHSWRRCGNVKVGHAYCWSVKAIFWGKLMHGYGDRCEKLIDECKEDFRAAKSEATFDFLFEEAKMRLGVYHIKYEGSEKVHSVQKWQEALNKLPARQPK